MRKSPNPEMLDLIFAKMEDESISLTTTQQIRYDRLIDAYTHWLANPILPDNRMRDYIMARYNVTARAAYQDIAIIKALFGKVPMANKEMMRHKANHLYDMAAAAAIAKTPLKNAFENFIKFPPIIFRILVEIWKIVNLSQPFMQKRSSTFPFFTLPKIT